MHRLNHIIFLSGILLIPCHSWCQSAKEHIEVIIESIIENLGEDIDAIQLTEDLERLADRPLDFNSATAEELSMMHILNEIQIQKLLEYRNQYGPVYSVYELALVDGLNREVLERMIPFVRFEKPVTESRKLSDAKRYSNQELLARSQFLLQKQKGFLEKEDGTIPYEGDRFKHFIRYRFKADDLLSAGFTAEKDAGEAFFNGTNRNGFDFYSAHISFRLNPVIDNITVGDFQVRAGQGLVLWQGFSGSRSVWVLDVSKKGQGSRPFTSADENQFFRGISTTMKLGNGSVNFFYSDQRADANLETDEKHGLHFTSLQNSGYHRTAHETEDENSIRYINAGAVASWNFKNFHLGTTILHQSFSVPFHKADQLYNLHQFRGERNYAVGSDYLYNRGKYLLFGEAALSRSGGKAILNGAGIHIHDQLGLTLLFHHFDKNFHSFWGNAFAGGLMPSGEKGFYSAIRYNPARLLVLSAYYDFIRNTWITYNTAAPGIRHELLLQADFKASQRIQFYIRYRNISQDQKSLSGNRYVNVNKNTGRVRFHLQYQLNDKINLRTRVEHVHYNHTTSENGFAAYQDLNIKQLKLPVQMNFRLAWFNTESYYTSIYAYENDLLYTFAIPAYYGRGWRGYINLRYRITKNLEFWFKIGNTIRTDSKTIGSGYNLIDRNQKTEVKAQLRLKL